MIHRLRPAESSDFSWMLALHREHARPLARRRDEPFDETEHRARFTEIFASCDVQVVEVDGRRVGLLALREDDGALELVVVSLEPAWQGRGLGTRLVHDVLLQARAASQAVVASRLDHDPAAALLRRLGFWPEGDVADQRVTLRWEAGVRTEVTLREAMSPWLDPGRRRAWAARLFDEAPDAQLALARFIAGRYERPERPAVLDADAGTGRRLRGLAAWAGSVTASCPDPELGAAAARVVAAIGPTVALREQALGQLDDRDRYDLALVLDGALWTVLEHEARVDALRRLGAALRPGGVLVIEGPNGLALLRGAEEPRARTELYHRAQVSRIPQQSFDLHDGVLERRDAIVVDVEGEDPVEWIERRRIALMGLPLLRAAVDAAGLCDVEVFRDLDATGPGRITGPRIVLTARGPSRPSRG